MSLLESILQSQLQHIQKGIELLNNRQTLYNEVTYCSLIVLSVISIGILFFMYRKRKMLKTGRNE